MQNKYVEFRQIVYDLMMGYADNHTALPVQDEFLPDSRCRKLLEKIHAANNRLSDRLGAEEDPDTEALIDAFYAMQDYLCKKMFDYGAYFERTAQLPPAGSDFQAESKTELP